MTRITFLSLASIDFCFPNIVTGSSDRQIRYFDLSTSRGWTTEAATHVRRPRGPVDGHQEDDTTPAPWYRNRYSQQHRRRSQNVISGSHLPASPWAAPHTVTKYTPSAAARWNELVRLGVSLSLTDHSCSCGNNVLVSSSGERSAAYGGGGIANANVALPLEEMCFTCGGAGRVHPTAVAPRSAGGVGWDGHQRSTVEHGHGHGHGATRGHGDLVRAVAMNDNVVVSGSYDATIKVRVFCCAATWPAAWANNTCGAHGIFFDRCGIVVQAPSLRIFRMAMKDVYLALQWIAPR